MYQKITEYLNPFTQLPEQQKALNIIQERQALQTNRALEQMERRLAADTELQQELLRQVARTNTVLEQLTKPNWFQRNFMGKK